MKKTFTVKDVAGLHARPASLLVQVASKYPDEAFINYSGKKITLKSIMAVMSLGIPSKEVFEIEVTGENEAEVLEKLEEVLIVNEVV